MKHLRHFLVSLFLGCVLTAPAAAQSVELLIEEGGAVENPPASLKLEYKFKAGDIQKYDITITGEGLLRLPDQQDQAKLEARTTMRCIRHLANQPSSDGNWRVEWDTVKATMLIPEFGEIYLTVPPIQYEMDKRGRVKALKGLDKLAVCPGLPQQKTLGDILGQLPSGGFPDKEIKPDDTWEDLYEIALPEQERTMIKVTSKFLGFEKVLEKNCVKIESTYEAPFTLDINKLRGIEESPEEAKTGSKPADSAAAKPAGEEAAKKPQIVEGTEKGVVWTYFAYEEGMLLQTHGKIELKADNKSETKGAAKPAEPKPAAAESSESVERTHDIDLTYQTVCLLVTGKDTDGQEEGPKTNE